MEHLHSRDVHTVLSFGEVVNWHCHTVLRGSFPVCAFSSEVKLSFVPRLDVGVQGSSPSGLSTLFYLLLAATILEEGTTVERGPSSFGSDEFVWKYLSKDMLNGVDQSKERWHLEYACACCVLRTTPLHVCHAPKKFAEKTFVALHQSSKFTKVFSLESFPLYGYLHIVVFVNQSHHILGLLDSGKSLFNCSVCTRWALFQISFRPQQEIQAKLGVGEKSIVGPLSWDYGIYSIHILKGKHPWQHRHFIIYVHTCMCWSFNGRNWMYHQEHMSASKLHDAHMFLVQ